MHCLGALLRYRLLHEYRQAVGGTVWRKCKLLVLIVAPAFGLITVGGYYAFLVQSTAGLLNAGGPSRQRVLDASLLASGAITFFIMFIETLRQFWFAPDGELLALAPISARTGVAYRWLLALLHGAPWVGLFLSLPILTAFAFPQARLATKLLIVIFLVLFWIWVAAAALCVAMLLLALSTRWHVGRHGLYGTLYLLNMLIFSYIFLHLLTPSGWLVFAGKLHPPGWLALLPSHQIAAMTVQIQSAGLPCPAFQAAALIVTLGGPTLLFTFAALRLWHWAARPISTANPSGRASSQDRRFRSFSTSRSWAIIQKDFKDMTRNPVYRNSLIVTSVLLIIGLWAQARRASSSKLLTMTLPLIYMVPFLLSARAVSQEYRMLEFYKLVLPCRYCLLDAKLRVHVVINIAAILAASLPFFVLLKPGFQITTILYFAGAAMLFVPVLTALALALGTYFPDLSAGPSVFGVTIKGLAIYLFLGATLYSLLLNRMIPATGLYFVLLTVISAALYLGARGRLYSLIERRPR
jgi:hypothetical protein